MDDYNLPGNSRFIKREEGEEPQAKQEQPEQPVRQITSSAVRIKPSIGQKFLRAFFDGNDKPRKIIDRIVFEVILPETKSMIHEAGLMALDRAIGIDRSPGSRRTSFLNRPANNGYVNYSQTPNATRRPVGSTPQYVIKSDRVFDLDQILVPEKVIAEEIVNQLFDRIENYGKATVADFYTACGWSSEPTDHAWGWRSIDDFDIKRVRTEGWRISLPQPVPFSKER